MAGREAPYATALAGLIASAERWPSLKPTEDWPTFAGSFSRTKVVARNLDLGAQAWPPISLGEPLSADVSNSRVYSLRRVGEDSQRLLSYHPLLVGDLVLYNDQGAFTHSMPRLAPRPGRETTPNDSLEKFSSTTMPRSRAAPAAG